MTSYYKTLSSPVGELTLVATANGLAAILWEKDDAKPFRFSPWTEQREHPVLCEAQRQLQEYFSGARKRFSLPLDCAGTVFQKTVWQALQAIPFGETRSYGQIAHSIGRPNATRAVGAASGKNPVCIIAPCHRVIGADGALTGFAGGLAIKARLLAFEAACSK